MKTSSIFVFAIPALLATVQADFECPVTPGNSDAGLVEFGLAVQNLLSSYYQSMPVNASFFSTLPNNTSTDYLSNVMGLTRQAVLGVEALQQLEAPTTASMPSCKYTFPPVTDAISFLMTAYDLEATLCGTFIGLADYVMSPQAAFLMARLAAEHGIHASYIGSHMQAQVFMPNSTSLTPAFTPQEVLMSGTGVGYLGQFLNGCAMAPMAPCHGTVSIGMLGSNLTSQAANDLSPTSTTVSVNMASSSSATVAMATFTGGAQSRGPGPRGLIGWAALAAAFV